MLLMEYLRISNLHKNHAMGTLSVSNKTLDKYFSFLKALDIKPKKRLITKLEESIESEPSKGFKLETLFGAWEDDRDSHSIIKEIRDSRIEK